MRSLRVPSERAGAGGLGREPTGPHTTPVTFRALAPEF
jgi:hypothetical protein